MKKKKMESLDKYVVQNLYEVIIDDGPRIDKTSDSTCYKTLQTTK